MLHLIKSKILSQYKYLLIAVLFITYSIVINYFVGNKSKYNIDDSLIKGYISSYIIDGNKLTMEVTGKETVLCIYYFKEEKQISVFKNEYELGDIISLDGKVIVPKNNTVFNLFNYKEYLKYEGINFIFNVEDITKISDNKMFRYKIKNNIIRFIENNINKDYLYTFILSNGKYIDKDVIESYRINGIIHIFSVSGTNISLISLVLLKIFNRFKIKNILVIVILLFYIFLTDFSPPVLRAVLMFILLFINKKFKLNISTVNIMLILLSILIIIDPYIIYKIGFQYSYIISFYLILFSRIIERYKNKILKLFIISSISFLASLPITINSFFQINILSIILNMFFVPIISFIIFPLSLIVIVLPFLNQILRLFIDIFESLSLYASKLDFLIFTMSKINMVITMIYYIVITYILYGILNNKYKRLFILIILMVLHYNINYFNGNKEITFIDVGQGDSALIKMPYDKSNILIDTGGKEYYYKEEWTIKNSSYSLGEDTICMYLKSMGIRKLNYLILTHGDSDHMGEAINVINCVNIDNIIFNYGSINNNENNVIKVLKNKNINYYNFKEKDKIYLYKYELLFLNPNIDYGNENDNSLVMHLNIDNYKFLFTGDISKKIEESIIRKYDIDIDVLKVAHHGSKTSSSINFLKNITPKYSIISVGLDNKFGHPSEETVNNLNKVQSKILCTSIDGSIKFTINNDVTILTTGT